MKYSKLGFKKYSTSQLNLALAYIYFVKNNQIKGERKLNMRK